MPADAGFSPLTNLDFNDLGAFQIARAYAKSVLRLPEQWYFRDTDINWGAGRPHRSSTECQAV